MISSISHFISALRCVFWQLYLRLFGGGIGKGSYIYGAIKMFCDTHSKITIGAGATIQTGVVLAASESGKIIIGNQVYLGEYVILSSRNQIMIGNDVIIASHTFIVDFDHIFDDARQLIRLQGYQKSKVTVGNDVWIGAGCKILKGVTIGDGAVIGAASVVTKDVPPYTICVGNPAQVIRDRHKKKDAIVNES